MNGTAQQAETRRMPLYITLNPDDYAFVRACVEGGEVTSLDSLFETALGTFREHLLAFLTWTEGRTEDELKAMQPKLECTVRYDEPREQ